LLFNPLHDQWCLAGVEAVEEHREGAVATPTHITIASVPDEI
jgi:hypothetical protein